MIWSLTNSRSKTGTVEYANRYKAFFWAVQVQESLKEDRKMVLKKDDDHWAFLEEIEAPTWVDLTIEAKSTKQDIDDDWFHISHPFHQCSSRQLKAAFSHFGDGSENLDFYLLGPSSPKIPSSVSRSRGKHYKNGKWERDSNIFLSNKQHPVKNLSRKTLRTGSGSSQEIKPKPSYKNLKGVCGSKTSSDCESSLTGMAIPKFSKPISSIEDSRGSSSSLVIKAGESNSTSTITSESSQQQQQKALDVSSQTFGNTSGLLSVMRISLRKSCVMRQASRVEISRQTNGRKSSSSKSSVGSSSNPGHDVRNVKFMGRLNTDRTPESRNVVRMSQAAKNRVKVLNISKVSNAQISNRTSDSRKIVKTIVAKSANQEAAKSKALYHAQTKAPLTAATKAKDKVGVSRFNRLVAGGKENAVGRMAVNQKSSSRDIAAGGMARGQKMKKRSVPQKGDRTGLTGSKVSSQREGKNSMNAVQKTHFR